jgi:hypothetical protein
VSLESLRRRAPVAIFVLLLLVCLVLVGLACACFPDQATQALERTLAAIAHTPALTEIWFVVALALLMGATNGGARRTAARARSPAVLQRLLL